MPSLLRLETFTEFLKLADCAENWRVKHFWIDRQKQKDREEFSNLFLTCCKANQLIEDELRSCFYLNIKVTSRFCWSLSRKTNLHKMLKGYNMHFLRLSPVPTCRPHLRDRKAGSQANFFISTEAFPLIYFVSSAELLRNKTPVMGIH